MWRNVRQFATVAKPSMDVIAKKLGVLQLGDHGLTRVCTPYTVDELKLTDTKQQINQLVQTLHDFREQVGNNHICRA